MDPPDVCVCVCVQVETSLGKTSRKVSEKNLSGQQLVLYSHQLGIAVTETETKTRKIVGEHYHSWLGLVLYI